MYEIKERVRYSEVGGSQDITITSLVNYLQDCSTFHSADIGLTLDRLNELHKAWLLSYWDIYVERMPRLYENITVGTSPHAFRGVLGRRNFWIKDSEGNYLLRADSIWFCFDTERQRPVKIDEEMVSYFGELEDVLKLTAGDRKVQEPEEMVEAPAIKIEPHHIDTNHHVNNARYLQIADDVLSAVTEGKESFTSGRIRAEYRKAAVLGDIMIPMYGKSANGGIVVSLRSETGDVFCNIEFL
ncbi:MAG: acyl-ACP thioesterase [Oribacterium sp.]|nr:acyl-ACP thioesterase [Oribacterium sp.]